MIKEITTNDLSDPITEDYIGDKASIGILIKKVNEIIEELNHQNPRDIILD